MIIDLVNIHKFSNKYEACALPHNIAMHWASEGHREGKQVESVCLPTNLLRREREIEDCPVSLILIKHVISSLSLLRN